MADETLISVLQQKRGQLVSERNQCIEDRENRDREAFDADLNLKAAQSKVVGLQSKLTEARKEHDEVLAKYCDDGTNQASPPLLDQVAVLAANEKRIANELAQAAKVVGHREKILAITLAKLSERIAPIPTEGFSNWAASSEMGRDQVGSLRQTRIIALDAPRRKRSQQFRHCAFRFGSVLI
jgi:hypothetical protein